MKPIRWLRRGVTWAGLAVAGGAAVTTARHLVSLPQPLESDLPGESRIDPRREGDVFYTVAGPESADSVVLLHDFYPGASNYEFRRIFSRLAADYRVYAPDWLGFGMSGRPALAYTGEFYAHLLGGFLRETVGQRAIVLAHGLAANIAMRAASDEPDLFDRLILVTPHPLAGTEPGPTPAQSLVRLAQRSSLGLVPYAALATRSALHWQLRRRAAQSGEGAATDDALDHAYASSHQFGGQHAVLALLTGELDLPIQNAFALLEPPVLVIGGERDARHPRTVLEDLALLNPNAQLLTIAGAGAAVAEDEPAAFVERMETWLRSPRGRYVPPLSGAWTHSTDAPAVTEQFGEPRGLVAPAPGLDALAGLAAHAPEAVPLGAVEDTPLAPASAPTDAAAPDQLRRSMDAPDAPVPTTLAAMTAPLDVGAPREEEGAIAPASGPHPVPADAREADPPTGGASQPTPQGPSGQVPEEPVVVIVSPADEALDVPRSPGVGEPSTPTEPAQATWPADVADATALSAQALAHADALRERAAAEAQPADRTTPPAPPERVTADDSADTAAVAAPGEAPMAATKPRAPAQKPPHGNGKTGSQAASTSARLRPTGGPRAPSRSSARAAPGPQTPKNREARPEKNRSGSPRPSTAPDERKHTPRKGKQSQT